MFDYLAVVIPIRMGSSRIKNKALLKFDNTNLLEWKIKQLLEVMPSENIFVSTENDILKEIAQK